MNVSKLESKIDELIVLCDEFQRTGSSLEADRDKWQQERRQLLGKNKLAKTRIEAMITRLKSLEQD